MSEENKYKESQENEKKNKKRLNFMQIGINCIRQLNFLSIESTDIFSMSIFYMIIDKSYYHTKKFDSRLMYTDTFNLNENLIQLMYEPENSIKILFFIDELKNLLTRSSK